MAAVPEFEPFSFSALVEQSGDNLGWLVAVLSFDSLKKFGVKKGFNVRVYIDDLPFESTLFPTGTGQHYLMLTNAIKEAGRLVPGQRATFLIENDPVPRQVALSERFEEELNRKADLAAIFYAMAPSHRRYWFNFVESAKTSETYGKRMVKMFEKLDEILQKKGNK